MIKKSTIILVLCALMVSCDLFKKDDQGIPVARVGETYLYQRDIEHLVPTGTSLEDSTLMVNGYITRWATRLLLVDGAKRNLSEETQKEFAKLVNQYQNDLYTKAYVEALVKRSIDTSVSLQEAQKVYEANRESFKLNEELIKLRYINIPQNILKKEEIEKSFKRYNDADKKYLDSIAIQFKSYSLNDSIWIKVSHVSEKIPVVTPDIKKDLLKKSNFIQLKDSLDLYLMQINEVLEQNDYAPLEYVKPTVKQIIINRRKLDLIKQLEKDITKDAIKNNQFEIYN